MAVDLQQILADSKECAENVWWQVLDEKNFERARENFIVVEGIISKYAGTKPNLELAAGRVVEALKNYDKFTESLKIDIVNIDIAEETEQNFKQLYKALGENMDIAKHSVGWLINFARARVAGKKND